jgi:predicted dehydrogenase
MDPDLGLAEAVAAPLGAGATSSLDAMIADGPIDIAVIGSPNAFHASQIIALIQAGVRGFLAEKPLAVTHEEAKEIQAAVEAAGAALVIGAMHTYDPGWLQGLEALEALGDLSQRGPFHVRSVCHLPNNSYFEDQANRVVRPDGQAPTGPASGLDPAAAMLSGGVLGLAIHNLPHIRRFVPRLTQVAHAQTVNPWGYSITASGPAGTVDLVARTAGTWQVDWTLTVYGRDFQLGVTFPPSYVHAGSAATRLQLTDGATRQFGPHLEDGYLAEWTELFAVMEGQPPLHPPSEAVADLDYALDLAEAAVATLAASGPSPTAREELA